MARFGLRSGVGLSSDAFLFFLPIIRTREKKRKFSDFVFLATLHFALAVNKSLAVFIFIRPLDDTLGNRPRLFKRAIHWIG